MAKIEWNESLSLGVAELDKHHKDILLIMSLFLDALQRGQDEDAISTILSKLKEYTLFHFSAEEAFMEKIEYPYIKPHRAKHVELKNKVNSFQYARFRHENLTPEDYKELISNWLIEHILQYDFKIVKYLQENKNVPENFKDKVKADWKKVKAKTGQNETDEKAEPEVEPDSRVKDEKEES
ncbi:bacteriohemerythrin [Desulfovibrio gilichinskyi]|uniref:Hemerythrin n=1 Tax=Desulfovibrio gilichinskyi TaxID=1519643 RepID=A0A1X7EL86_9BACT|nr:hemerythrin family protein [Desulfovibrio gilichinskyi]SMF35868.1 hemerythrin [Desulfovibrio gilichinskyi]